MIAEKPAPQVIYRMWQSQKVVFVDSQSGIIPTVGTWVHLNHLNGLCVKSTHLFFNDETGAVNVEVDVG